MKRQSGGDEDTGRYNPEKDTKRCRYFGLGLATGISAAVLAFAIAPQFQEPKQNPEPQQKAAAPAVQQADKKLPAIDFNLYRSQNNEWAGMKITIDTMLIDDWARYAPVTITIPELSYAAPFPVEQGCKSVETTFPRPVPSTGTYHYIILGRDPVTKNAKELYRHILAPQNK